MRTERFFGVAVGIVTNNKDPDGLGRVKASLPWMADQVETDWARVVDADGRRQPWRLFSAGGQRRGARGFRARRPGHPICAGGLWNGKDKPPESNSDGKNDLRTVKSRSGSLIRFTDTDGDAKIEIIDSSAKNTIVISTKGNSITITASGDVTIQSNNGKLKLTGNSVEITSASTVKIEASQSMAVKSSGDLTVKGQVVNIN